MEKIYKIIKTITFLIAGILVFIFSNEIMANEGSLINSIVGCVMLVYGIDYSLYLLLTKKVNTKLITFYGALINILLGLTMIFIIQENEHEFVTACVIWCMWSIMRESEEIVEKVIETYKDAPVTAILNSLESLSVIVFSILLINDPGEHHAHTHVILLGFELILEVSWVQLTHLEIMLRNKKKKIDTL